MKVIRKNSCRLFWPLKCNIANHDLVQDLEKAIQSICASLVNEVQEHIIDQFSTAVQQATTEACNTAQKWGLPVNRDDRAAGGLYWSTYKALCRRDGLYSNAQELHDWNTQLTGPIIKKHRVRMGESFLPQDAIRAQWTFESKRDTANSFP